MDIFGVYNYMYQFVIYQVTSKLTNSLNWEINYISQTKSVSCHSHPLPRSLQVPRTPGWEVWAQPQVPP